MGLFNKGKEFRKKHKPSYETGDEPRETYIVLYSTTKYLKKRKK